MRASVVVGIDRTLYANRGKLYDYLSMLDVCFSCFVLTPLVVAFWSSTWSSLNFLPLVHRPFLRIFAPVAIGFTILILFTTFQKHLQVIFTEHVGNRYIYLFSSRLYTEIFGIASVSSWYGIWTAFDTLTGANTYIAIIIVIVSYVGLLCSKTVRNITSSPFAIITDRKQGYFDVPTLFQWSFHWKKNKFLYILDSIFSVFIVGTLVILVWRGAWCILDHVVFPSNDGGDPSPLSAWTSLGIGYTIVIVTFISQSLMKVLMRKYDGWKRLVVLDTYIVISFCGTINVWRGLWLLLEHYVDYETSLQNCLLVHFFSFFILVIFNASNTLLVRGVCIDAEETGEDCVEFPCYYFRLHFQAKQKEKTLKELDKFNAIQTLQVNHKQVDDTSSLPRDAHELTEFIFAMDEQPNSTLLGEQVCSKCEETVQSLKPCNIHLKSQMI